MGTFVGDEQLPRHGSRALTPPVARDPRIGGIARLSVTREDSVSVSPPGEIAPPIRRIERRAIPNVDVPRSQKIARRASRQRGRIERVTLGSKLLCQFKVVINNDSFFRTGASHTAPGGIGNCVVISGDRNSNPARQRGPAENRMPRAPRASRPPTLGPLGRAAGYRPAAVPTRTTTAVDVWVGDRSKSAQRPRFAEAKLRDPGAPLVPAMRPRGRRQAPVRSG